MKLKRSVKILLISVGILILAGWMGQMAYNRFLTDIIVHIDSEHEHAFVSEADILAILQEQGIQDITTARLSDVNLKELEIKIKSYNFVADCQVSRDLKGNLIIDVKQNRPIARVIKSGDRGAYVGENGLMMPLSSKFTARVVLISGEGTDQFFSRDSLNDEPRKAMFELLSFLDKDEFWKAQVAQIDMDKKFNLTLLTQVGNQRVEFGDPRGYAEKFEKLRIFYREIAPAKGWNTYKRVNLKYQHQIICE